eukprot:scaffold288327_cov17-Prasinocladus_malaysianus.AAC.1
MRGSLLVQTLILVLLATYCKYTAPCPISSPDQTKLVQSSQSSLLQSYYTKHPASPVKSIRASPQLKRPTQSSLIQPISTFVFSETGSATSQLDIARDHPQAQAQPAL